MSSGVSNKRLGPVSRRAGPFRANLPPLLLASSQTRQRQPMRGVVSAPPVPRNKSSSRFVASSPGLLVDGEFLSKVLKGRQRDYLTVFLFPDTKNKYVEPPATNE